MYKLSAITLLALVACGGDDTSTDVSDKVAYDCTCTVVATDGSSTASVERPYTMCEDPEYADLVLENVVGECAAEIESEGLDGSCSCSCEPNGESCDE